jgi:hypothetical protein
MITRQSTGRTILVGPVLDSTGAAKTDEVIGNIKITKNGTVGAADGSATLTHDHAGKYKLALTANDCDTVGVLEISLNSGTNDMPVKGLNVVETAIWDALFADGATGLLPANVTQIGGDAQSATDLKDFADAGYDPATNKVQGVLLVDATTNLTDLPTIPANWLTAAGLAADAVTEIQSGLATATNVSDAQSAIIAQVDANETKIDAVKAKTDNLPSDPADQSVIIAATDAILTAVGTRSSQSSVDTIDTVVDAIKVKSDQLKFTTANKVDSTAVLDSASLRSALGMSAADLDAQLDAILAAASAGAGTGARTVTITVNDGTTALQNAVVRLTEGVNTFRALTNASGVATFNLDDVTYTVAITKSGYSYAGTTLVVDGTETRTYSMTVVSITPPDGPTKTVLTILCLDENGDADSGVNVSIRYVTVPTDSVDIAFPGASITKTSNGSGVATFQVIKGATIEYKRGTRDVWLEATMSDEDTTSITSFIGTP